MPVNASGFELKTLTVQLEYSINILRIYKSLYQFMIAINLPFTCLFFYRC